MQKRRLVPILILFTIITTCKISFAQNENSENTFVENFIDIIDRNDLERLKHIVIYPLDRKYPLKGIFSNEELVDRFEEVFDETLRNMIINSNISEDWKEVGWRGIMFRDGLLWLDHEGKLIAINYQSDFEKKKRTQIINKDKQSIHKSLRNFEEPVLIMETEKFRIRIDQLEDGNFRYASWLVKSKMTEEPDLVLNNGEWIPDGNGGNQFYRFTNGEYEYVCYIHKVGSVETPPAELKVYKKDLEILKEPVISLFN